MIRDVLLVQKRELEKRLMERYVERNVDLKKFNNNLIKVITGPRRAGKSFFAMHTINKFGKFGYANFDDERLVSAKDYDEIINTLKSLYNNPKYLLFDEIQNLDKWELFVNRIQRQGYNIILTGSNSKLLSRELASHLTGRHLLVSILPFSFKEFINLESKELTKSEIKTKLFSYLVDGGYPEPLIKKIDRKDYLSTLYSSIIYKDIVRRFRIRFVQAIEDLSNCLISNVAQEFSYTTLSKVAKCKSVHTVEKYLGYLEESFIFFRLNRFSYKIKEQISSNKKIYCVDNGFINAMAFRFSPDIGKLYENAVALKLKKMEIDGKINIYYWKNARQEEVDFVVKQGGKIRQLVQVCYNLDESNAKKREITALLKGSKELKCRNLLVLTEDYEASKEISWFGVKRKVKFIPLWKWLLGLK